MTDTSILEGRLRCRQPIDGYRFAVDSLLLAWFVLDRWGQRPGHGVELGGGCGVVSAAVLTGGALDAAELVEIQESHHLAALGTAAMNGLEGRMRCHHADLRTLTADALDGRPDVVYSNPPFHPVGEGRIPPKGSAAISRHEVCATMDDLLDAAARLLPSRGHLYLTYPASRLGDLLAALPARHLTPIHLALAWGDAAGDASRLLLEARKDVVTPLSIGPPITMDGPWQGELCAMLDAAADKGGPTSS